MLVNSSYTTWTTTQMMKGNCRKIRRMPRKNFPTICRLISSCSHVTILYILKSVSETVAVKNGKWNSFVISNQWTWKTSTSFVLSVACAIPLVERYCVREVVHFYPIKDFITDAIFAYTVSGKSRSCLRNIWMPSELCADRGREEEMFSDFGCWAWRCHFDRWWDVCHEYQVQW